MHPSCRNKDGHKTRLDSFGAVGYIAAFQAALTFAHIEIIKYFGFNKHCEWTLYN